MLAFKKVRLLLIGFPIILLAGTGCSIVGPIMAPIIGPSKAEIAAKEKQEQIQADKVAAEAKAKAKKKAEAEEDAVQVSKPETVEALKAEKLSEPKVAPEAVEEESAATATTGAAPVALIPDMAPATTVAGSVPVKHEIPTEPNTYLVTVEAKDKTHPLFNQGSKLGFTLNGHQGGHIIAKRGSEITFQVRSGVRHDFYLTTALKGWGATPFVKGVSGQFTYKGDVTFKPASDTPNDLFYGCRNHNSMGGRIVVVDENADIAAVEKKLDAERLEAAKNAKSVVDQGIKPQKVSQKIAYVAMMLQFKGKGLPAEQRDAIKAKLENAKQLQKKGELAAAFAVAQEANGMITSTGKKTGPTKEELEELKEELNDYMITLEAFIDSHKASYDHALKQGAKVVDYDHDLVEKLILDAVALSTNDQYERAKTQIKKAEREVTKALNDMLNATTIVYDLNFETPADEYAYEVRKYEGYIELIPVAIEVKKPRASMIALMKTYVKKGAFFKEKSDEAAKAERWEEAMVVIRDATIEVRRGLRLLGVSM